MHVCCSVGVGEAEKETSSAAAGVLVPSSPEARYREVQTSPAAQTHIVPFGDENSQNCVAALTADVSCCQQVLACCAVAPEGFGLLLYFLCHTTLHQAATLAWSGACPSHFTCSIAAG